MQFKQPGSLQYNPCHERHVYLSYARTNGSAVAVQLFDVHACMPECVPAGAAFTELVLPPCSAPQSRLGP